MPSFITAAALVATASLSLAAPTKTGNTFEVKQVEAGKVLKSGPLSMVKTFRKYGKAPPANVVNAAAAAQQSGSVQNNPTQYDSEYVCPVTVGNQQLTLDFDTGSSDLWVFSTLTPSSEQSGHTLYNPSSGSKIAGETFKISYGDGSGASGVVYADKVVVGGVTATTQAVEAATSVSSEFESDSSSDGLLGLAFSSGNQCSPKQETTFFDTVGSTLAEKVFTADLKHNAPGAYTFGYVNSAAYTGSIAYTAVDNSESYWGFTANGYSIGSGNSTAGSIGSSIADTGTTLMYLPTAAVQAYYKQVSGATNSNADGGYIFPCSATLPDFNVNIGGKVFTVPGSYVNYSPASGSSCFGGIQENTGIGLTIFGDIFLKSVYAIFDETQSTPRLGFAAKTL